MFKKKAGKIFSLIVAMGVAFSTIVTVTASAQAINSADDMYIDFDPNIGNPGAGSSFTVVLRDVDTDAAISGPVSWRTSDSSVASVSGSTATATVSVSKNNSTFELTATSNGFTVGSGTWHTRQVDSHVTSVTVSPSSLSLEGKGSTGQITARLTSPDNNCCIDGDELPRVISSNSSVAVGSLSRSWNTQIFGGSVNITAVGNGTCTITIQTASGPSASCRVTVSGCGGSTTVTNNPRPSNPSIPTVGSTKTGHSAGTTAIDPATGKPVSPTGTTAIDPATGKPVSPTGQTSSGTASNASSGTASASKNSSSASKGKGAVSGTTDSAASNGIVALTSTKNNNSGNGPLIPIIICIGIGVLLGTTAIVMYRVHRAKEKTKDPDDIGSMDETAEINIPNDPEDKGDGQK